MKVLVITPPVIQLNSPYPSGAYLCSFFKNQNDECNWKDLNISLFYKIFSASGIETLFSLTEKKALEMADIAESQNDKNTAFNLRRYICTKQNWIEWIDFIVEILCGKMREKEHEFLYSPFAPRGSRMENFLASLNREPTVDDVRFLCSYALADLADYITAVFDKDFSLVRYAESLCVDERDFLQIQKQLESPVLKVFYEQVLQENLVFEQNEIPELICISVPFAGTFLPALYAADFIKKKYQDKIFVAIGGGFVNTQLRETTETGFSKFIDAFSFDRGYGSYLELKTHFESIKNHDFFQKNSVYRQDCESLSDQNCGNLYKLQLFYDDKTILPLWKDEKISQIENELTANIMPDYQDIDFSIYPRVCDDLNPMHRIWNDGSWIKAYLAHGCYWHKCAFCDTQLDYVCGYKIVQTEKLFFKLLETAELKKVYGIHFVDEALPPKALKKFALLNAQNGKKLYFWGNVRFEKTFTKDFAAFLSYCGFGGASAGLEVATENGLKTINKGTDIDSIISACAAFKEAGILVHAYMIYGFWNDTSQSIINSMETLRQFFESGLLDSAFWHKFVLTKNSQVFYEWKRGLHKDLIPIQNLNKKSIFADLNMHFKGEKDFDKFSIPLENALNSWMHGKNLQTKVQKWFDFQVPSPTIPKDFVKKQIQNYLDKNDQIKISDEDKDIFWLGSKPIVKHNKSTFTLCWFYLQEDFQEILNRHDFDDQKKFDFQNDFLLLFDFLSPSVKTEVHENAVKKIKNSKSLQKVFTKFHQKGLVIF
ncbi:MAG: radical SAM protein [Spirochaetales bacterium]|nr:radical SAM protein [Spirochaetales bacterium]MDY5914263.1 radical SAM protein [Treponema sp.]